MPDAHSSPASQPSARGVMARAPGETTEIDPAWEAREQRVRVLIVDHLPEELKKLAMDLMDSLRNNAGVAERFDAFCVQAFSKPEWAVPASAVIGELFEDNEDRLAELARVPDLVIELGCGQAAVACTVAARWAARGETHRLSRLAESIIAAQGTMRNAAAVEVMLALAGTLAVSRPSRAEQLFNAALPAAEPEQEEAVADARSWLETGRVVCSASQEVRDLWDIRLRRPRTAWKWETDEERRALAALADQIQPGLPGVERYQRIVPGCWWDVVMSKARLMEQLEKERTLARASQPADSATPLVTTQVEGAEVPESRAASSMRSAWGDDLPPGVNPRASGAARVVLGWAAGVFMMALTALLAPDGVYRLVKDIRSVFNPAPVALTPEQLIENHKRWRAATTQSMAQAQAALAASFQAAKSGSWKDMEGLLSGHQENLPFTSDGYMQLLVWLHLDPPADVETLSRLPRLLLNRVDTQALALWERLVYPGSPNAEHIQRTAREALAEKEKTWDKDNTERLRQIADGKTVTATAE
ncbi:MAG: hypothetical protein HS117_13505 [Verrucomicrobiaceae bacterium]|nr:hypothetical protein [Verrucomicrobiaceae bacterium]